MKIYRKLDAVCLNLAPFTCNNWEFDTDNFDKLKRVVPQNEKKIFFIDSLFESTLEKLILITSKGGRKLLGEPEKVSKKDIEHSNR